MVGLLGQNQLQNFFQNGLLGLGGPSAALGTALPENSMQQFYDPAAMKQYQLKRGLLGAGIGLLAQEPTIAPQNIGTQIGKGLGVGLLAADNAQQDYTQNALLASQMADQQSQREADMAQQQAMDAWQKSLPPQAQSLAGAFPQQVAIQQAQAMFAPPPQMQTEITDINGHRVIVDKRSGQVIKDLGPSPSNRNSAPTGYQFTADGRGVERIPGYRDTQLEADLRKQFDAQTAPFRDVRDAYNRIQSSANNPTPAGDLALIYNYMKMLDPGSVVRESEFAMAAATGSYGERIKAAVNRVSNGQRLSEAERADFLDRSHQLYGQQESTFNALKDQYTGIATRNGLAPENVVVTPLANPAPSAAGGPPAEAVADLKADPSPQAMQEFDAVFGQGAAQRVLQGQ
jgi:hypothetical protein